MATRWFCQNLRCTTIALIITATLETLSPANAYSKRSNQQTAIPVAKIYGREFVSFEDDEIKKGEVEFARLSSDGKVLVLLTKKSLYKWSAETGELVAKIDSGLGSDTEVIGLAIATTNDDVAILLKEDKKVGIQVWGISTKTRKCSLEWHDVRAGQIAYSANQGMLVAGLIGARATPLVTLLDTANGGRELRTIVADPETVVSSPNGDVIATSRGNFTQLWDAFSGQLVCEIPAAGLTAFSGDSKRVAIKVANGIVLADTQGRTQPRVVPISNVPARFKLSPDANLIASVVPRSGTISIGGGFMTWDPGLGIGQQLQFGSLFISDLITGQVIAELIEESESEANGKAADNKGTTVDWNFRDQKTLIAVSIEGVGQGRKQRFPGGTDDSGNVRTWTRYLYDHIVRMREYNLGNIQNARRNIPPPRKTK